MNKKDSMTRQIPKEDTRNKIMQAAKKEFLTNGYEKTTLRTICKQAGVTTGALYFFFENKANLFDELVGKTAAEFEAYFHQSVAAEKEYSQDLIAHGKGLNADVDSAGERRTMAYFYPRREEFLILMRQSKGSRYEEFAANLHRQMIAAFESFYNLYTDRQEADPALHSMIPLLVSWRIDSYLALLAEDLPLEEVLIRTEMIARYAVGGWNAVMEGKK